MGNYEKFILRIKKDKIAACLILLFFFVAFLICMIYLKYNKIIIILFSCWILYIVLLAVHSIYKLNSFWVKLSDKEKQILDNELKTLFFESPSYSLTENYIIDLENMKMISYDSIIKIEKKKRLTNTKVNSSIETYAKVYTSDGTYEYLIDSKCSYIKIQEEDPYYPGLYEYIKFKNPKL